MCSELVLSLLSHAAQPVYRLRPVLPVSRNRFNHRCTPVTTLRRSKMQGGQKVAHIDAIVRYNKNELICKEYCQLYLSSVGRRRIEY